MTRIRTSTIALAVILLVAQARGGSQSPGPIRFEDFAPTTFSIVTHDSNALAASWADVLGIPKPATFQPEAVYPPNFKGDRAGRPTMATLQTANMTISMHQPPPLTYWKEILDTHGQLLYRMNFRVRGIADQTSYFEGKGGTLVIGDPAKVPYVNVNLWPKYGVALELNGVADDAGPAKAPPPAPAGSFAANPVRKITFVVPNIDEAIRDYADLFGIKTAPERGITPAYVFPEASAADRKMTMAWAKLAFPNGVILELNEPRGGTSIWRDHLQKHGRSIFSVGFRVANVRDAIAYLTSKGGVLAFGGPDTRYAGIDFKARLGLVIEIAQ